MVMMVRWSGKGQVKDKISKQFRLKNLTLMDYKFASPSAYVIFPLYFWETSLDARDRSDKLQEAIS